MYSLMISFVPDNVYDTKKNISMQKKCSFVSFLVNKMIKTALVSGAKQCRNFTF